METKNRPNAALINREWFESAAKALQRDDLCDVLFSAVTYVLYGDVPENLNKAAEIVFTMVRPALDSDITKYRERCARNAANARSQRQRVAASGTQSQPVGANTTTTTTSTSTSTSTEKQSLSNEDQIEKEKWLLFGYFWSTGSKAIAQELNAFWSYYEALGWKNNKGAAIVNKLAAARMWRRQFETGQVPDGAQIWFSVVKECPVRDYSLWQVYAGAEKNGDLVRIRLRCTEKYIQDLNKAMPNLIGAMRGVLRCPEVTIERC